MSKLNNKTKKFRQLQKGSGLYSTFRNKFGKKNKHGNNTLLINSETIPENSKNSNKSPGIFSKMRKMLHKTKKHIKRENYNVLNNQLINNSEPPKLNTVTKPRKGTGVMNRIGRKINKTMKKRQGYNALSEHLELPEAESNMNSLRKAPRKTTRKKPRKSGIINRIFYPRGYTNLKEDESTNVVDTKRKTAVSNLNPFSSTNYNMFTKISNMKKNPFTTNIPQTSPFHNNFVNSNPFTPGLFTQKTKQKSAKQLPTGSKGAPGSTVSTGPSTELHNLNPFKYSIKSSKKKNTPHSTNPFDINNNQPVTTSTPSKINKSNIQNDVSVNSDYENNVNNQTKRSHKLHENYFGYKKRKSSSSGKRRKSKTIRRRKPKFNIRILHEPIQQ